MSERHLQCTALGWAGPGGWTCVSAGRVLHAPPPCAAAQLLVGVGLEVFFAISSRLTPTAAQPKQSKSARAEDQTEPLTQSPLRSVLCRAVLLFSSAAFLSHTLHILSLLFITTSPPSHPHRLLLLLSGSETYATHTATPPTPPRSATISHNVRPSRYVASTRQLQGKGRLQAG